LRILLIHNRYSEYGGEDKVFDELTSALAMAGQVVAVYEKDSRQIRLSGKSGVPGMILQSFFGWKTKRELNSLIDAFRPDIAHVHNVYPLISFHAYTTLHRRGIPIFQTLHNYRFICANGLFFRSGRICTDCLERQSSWHVAKCRCYHDSFSQSLWYGLLVRLFRNGRCMGVIDQFVALNPFMREMAVKAGVDAGRICIIPNYIESPAPLPQREAPPPHKEAAGPYFLVLGRLSVEKGIDVILDAVSFSKGGFSVRITGDGPDSARLRKKAAGFKTVSFTGFAGGDEKRDLLLNAQALVITSVWYENFPSTVLEALSLGTPVVAPRIGGVQHMVEDGIDGLLYEPGNPESLGAMLTHLAGHPDEVGRLRRNALESFQNKYTREHVLDKLLRAYSSFLA
jgi:glycosyltransferase involved in cell wall biosynthesis